MYIYVKPYFALWVVIMQFNLLTLQSQQDFHQQVRATIMSMTNNLYCVTLQHDYDYPKYGEVIEVNTTAYFTAMPIHWCIVLLAHTV